VRLCVGADKNCRESLALGARGCEREHRLGDVDADAATAGAERVRDRERRSAGAAADVEHAARAARANRLDQQTFERTE
jgi:hypothetical protein